MDSVTLSFWQVLVATAAFLTLLAGGGRLLLAQFKEALDAKFELLENRRATSTATWTALHERLREEVARTTSDTIRLERDLAALHRLILEQYIKREDAEHLVERVMGRIDRLSEELREHAARHTPPHIRGDPSP